MWANLDYLDMQGSSKVNTAAQFFLKKNKKQVNWKPEQPPKTSPTSITCLLFSMG